MPLSDTEKTQASGSRRALTWTWGGSAPWKVRALPIRFWKMRRRCSGTATSSGSSERVTRAPSSWMRGPKSWTISSTRGFKATDSLGAGPAPIWE